MSSQRGQWSNKRAFIMSAIGSAVGLGNIWRYPYTAYKNGGGSFLIPYFIAILTAGIPLLILEFTLGHKMKGSAPHVFSKINKKYEIFGWFPSVIAFFISIYYSVIVGWAINYMLFSFNLGWGDNASDFFFGSYLKTTSSPLEIGSFSITAVLFMVVVWFFVWLATVKQVKGIEKFNLFLIPTLVIIMIIIIIRGVMLPGAYIGLNHLFTPKWESLLNPEIWMEAYGQVFFSLSVAMGIMIAYSSYLPDKADIANSAIITGFSNSAFEFSAAIGVFAILGFIEYQTGAPASSLSGIGLAFIAFPTGFSTMGPILGRVFSFLFFSALVCAGLTSLISLVEACASAVIDKLKIARTKVVTVICIVCLTISLIFTTGAGVLILDIVDKFINSFGIVVVGLIETIIIGWFYGTEHLVEHSNATSHFKIGRLWSFSIKFVIPTMLLVTIVTSTYQMIVKGYESYTTNELLIVGVGTMAAVVLLTVIFSKFKWSDKHE